MEVLEDVSSGNAKVPQSHSRPAGKFPVVDQGQSRIAGYVDDESLVCKAELPVIVFGDHTRVFKYVDFRFCVGADGVKVLHAKCDADPKYLYHFLRHVSIPSDGYARHYKHLKHLEIPLPPLPEQRRIAAILDRAEALRAKRRATLDRLDGFASALFEEMFGDPIVNPREMSLRTLKEIVDSERPISYGILMPGPAQEEGVKYVRVVDMKDDGIDLTSVRYTTATISNSYRRSLLRSGDLVLSIRGHVGRLATVPKELDGANITQDTARLSIRGASPTFVRECLRTRALQRWMTRHTKGVAVKGINLGDVKRIPIIIPPERDQQRFASIVEILDSARARLRTSLAQLDSLFASLQHRAFRGEL